MIRKTLNFVNNIILKIEESKTPITYFVLSFIFIVTTRCVLEVYSDSTYSFSYTTQLIPFNIYYIATTLAMIILFKLFNKNINIIKITKVILLSFIIILSAPIADLILSKGAGFDLAYLYASDSKDFFYRFFHFFGEIKNKGGITFGMKIEVALILIGSFLYSYIKNKKIIKSFLLTFFVYVLVFAFLATPTILKPILIFFNFSPDIVHTEFMTNFYLVLIFFFSLNLFYQINKNLFYAIFKDIRIYRFLHFTSMFILGLALGMNSLRIQIIEMNSVVNIVLTIISLLFAWLFSVTSNNIADYDIDKISNPDRPLFKSNINIREYKIVSWSFMVLSLIYAYFMGYPTFFVMLLFIGNYFLYSMPPFRLKRVPLFSKIFISINSLALIVLGFLNTAAYNEMAFPNEIILFFLIAFTAAINFIDIKDYEGDKACGIKTLPVLLGLRRSKFIIGIFFLLSYFSVYYFIFNDKLLIIPLFVFGIISFYFVNKKNYKEKYVFITYLFSTLGLIAYLLL